MKRKGIIFLICMVLCVSMLSACGKDSEPEGASSAAAGTQEGGSFFDRTTEAGEAEASTTAAASQEAAAGKIAGPWTIEGMTMEQTALTDDTDKIDQAFSNLSPADGKYVMAVFTITEGRIMQARLNELINDDLITYNGQGPESWAATGLTNADGDSQFDLSEDIYISGDISCLFDVSPDLDIGSIAVVVDTDQAGGAEASEEETTAAEIDMSESLDGKTYQWGDCTFILTTQRDCDEEENERFNEFLIPNGKWAIVSFKVVSGSIDADTLDVKLKENLTLGGSYIAVITQRTSQDDQINAFGGVFVVPDDFDTENASLTIVEY